MAISIDSTLKEILDCPEAVAVVDKYSPGFSKNSMLKIWHEAERMRQVPSGRR